MACCCGQKDEDKSLALLRALRLLPWNAGCHSIVNNASHHTHVLVPLGSKRPQSPKNFRRQTPNILRPKDIKTRMNRFLGYFWGHWEHVLCERSGDSHISQ